MYLFQLSMSFKQEVTSRHYFMLKIFYLFHHIFLQSILSGCWIYETYDLFGLTQQEMKIDLD